MDPKKRLEFIHKMTKMGLDHLQHLDIGGTVNNAVDPNKGLAGTIGGLLGTTDNFQAGSADINAGTTQGQLNQAYNGVQTGLNQQQGIADTLNPQVAQGVAQQQQLAQQFAAQANGTGPSVAVNQLNQATQANTANQAALMASQRGAGANAGLIARQAAQQGAANQQQAAGQAATLKAQEQIAGQQNLASLSGNQISQAGSAVGNSSQAQQGEQNILQNANTSANNAAVNMQSNINNTNSQTAMANQNSANGLVGGLLKGASGAFGFAEGGEVAKPTGRPNVAPDSHPEKYEQTMSNGWDNLKSVFKADGGAIEKEMYASGGMRNPISAGYMQRFAVGGSAITGNPLIQGPGSQAPQSFAANWLNQPSTSIALEGQQTGAMPQAGASLADSIPGKKTPDEIKGSEGALPGETLDTFNGPSLAGGASDAIAPTEDVPGGGSSYQFGNAAPMEFAASGGKMTKNQAGRMLKDKLMKKGGKVKAKSPDEKAVSATNSYANDKVPAMLSEGEVVMDLNTLHDKGPLGQMARTVAAEIAKRNKSKGGK